MSTCGSSRVLRSSRCSRRMKHWLLACATEAPGLTIDAASVLLPSDAAQATFDGPHPRPGAASPRRRRRAWLARRRMRDSGRVRWTLFFSGCRDFSIPSSASLSTGIERMAWAISSAGSCHASRTAGPLRPTRFPRTPVRRAPSNGSRRAAPRGDLTGTRARQPRARGAFRAAVPARPVDRIACRCPHDRAHVSRRGGCRCWPSCRRWPA